MRKNIFRIDLNAEFQKALNIMENSSHSIFVTGRAGTGKSTLLDYFRNTTHKKVAVLAPTGVAALNVKGQTIHSFFKFKPNITQERIKKLRFSSEKQNIYRKLNAIVIDEISMVRADLLDCVDKFLRLNGPSSVSPFGGIQMIFFGDLYQLPPVVTGAERAVFEQQYKTPYFFDSTVFQSFEMEFIELEKVYRQRDKEFIHLLNSIRNRSIEDDGLSMLNQRFLPDFRPPNRDFYISLTTTNALAEQTNRERLNALRGQKHSFTGTIEGEFSDEYLPTAVNLELKTGAQVMLLNNDFEGRWVNGSIGEVAGFSHNSRGENIVRIELSDGETVEVAPFTWEIYNYFVEGAVLKSEIVGSFTQYPIMLAWAVTIHKSQGKTFEKVIIDFGRGTFTHGQAYVALSRCTTLYGIVLKQPFQKKHILMDFKVVSFLTRFQYHRADQIQNTDSRIEMISQAIKNRTALQIVYLKPNDEKSRRVIKPSFLGEMEFQGKSYTGIRAFCLMRNQERTFRIDRILEMQKIQK